MIKLHKCRNIKGYSNSCESAHQIKIFLKLSHFESALGVCLMNVTHYVMFVVQSADLDEMQRSKICKFAHPYNIIIPIMYCLYVCCHRYHVSVLF